MIYLPLNLINFHSLFYLERFSEAERKFDSDWIEESELLQAQVALEFNLPRGIGVYAIQSAQARYPDDPDIMGPKAIATYARHNKRFRGDLRVGDDMPNVKLYTMDELNETSLFDLSTSSTKPLIIFAGSYSWPPFRGIVPAMNDTITKYKDLCDIVIVYIAEAHASDEWPISSGKVSKFKI